MRMNKGSRRAVIGTMAAAALAAFSACGLWDDEAPMTDREVADVAAAAIAPQTGGDASSLADALAAYGSTPSYPISISVDFPYAEFSEDLTVTPGTSGFAVDSSARGSVDRPRLSGSFERTASLDIETNGPFPVADGETFAVTVNGTAHYSGRHEYTSIAGSRSFSVSTETDQAWTDVVAEAAVSKSGGTTTIVLTPISGSIEVTGTIDRQKSGFLGTRTVAWDGGFTLTFSGGSATAAFAGGGSVAIDFAKGEAE